MEPSEAKRLKALEDENAKLKRLLAEAMLDNTAPSSGDDMLVLITYDVKTKTAAGRKRLRRISAACQDYGQRVQYSVFECEVSPAQWTALRAPPAVCL